MCGIAGYLNIGRSPFQVDEALLQAMQQTIKHRGPDGSHVMVWPEEQLGLAHRRLSIIDLSDNGLQPMMDDEQSVVISFNGEIYNHRELRIQLQAIGYRYFSQTDTETILYAYKEWGIECLQKLEGMFAFALYDFRTHELYLVRDRFGIKPLYFSLQGEVCSFASEIKALWQAPWIEKEINPIALSHYLTFMVTPAPMTLYEGIYKLPAAYYMKINEKRRVTFHEWYNPLLTTSVIATEKELNEEAFCANTIRSLLRDSIKKHMISDVPYGVFLSGGIDSSFNVSLMREFTDKVRTFNISFADGPEYCEIDWARKVSKRFNTDHYELSITEKEAFEFFQSMVYYQDEPLGDCVCIPVYYIAKLLKETGVSVVQLGEGSDELFCGYSSYTDYLTMYNRYWKPANKWIPAFAKRGISQIVSQLFQDNMYHKELLNNWAHNKHFFWSGAVAFPQGFKQDFIRNNTSDYDPIIDQIYPGFHQGTDSYAIVDYHLQQLRSIKPEADFYTSITYLELKHRLPELLLMRIDKMAMATSVEGRVPFLDHKLVEFALRVPTRFKYQQGITKYILKKSAEGLLPADVIYRKKMGFAAPISRWFKTGDYFKPFFQDMLHSNNNEWDQFIDRHAIQSLLKKNQADKQDYAVQLWVMQNLMAVKL